VEAGTDGSQVIARRVTAALLDSALLFAVFFVLALLFGEVETRGDNASVSVGAVGTVILAAVSLAYYCALETSSGQTLGKRALGIRVARLSDGAQPSGGEVLARTLLRVIDVLPFLYLVGFVVVVVTGRRAQRIGDLAAGTTVVRA
jgi:uncharacterized RDD family membrane protein YckC